MELSLTKEMNLAFEAITCGTNDFIWIGGKAGTGKSTFLQYLKKSNKLENCVYLAPTGVAALLIGGSTIHSFFLIKPEPIYLPMVYDKEFRNRLFPKLKKVKTIVIDEISMVRADLLDEIDRRMRAAKKKNNIPFGGAQVVIFGDPYQLPPVVDMDNSTKEIFYNIYRSSYFFSSSIVKEQIKKLRYFEFTKVFRQDDEFFLDLLDKCRKGIITDAELRNLDQCIWPEGKEVPEDMLILTTRRREALLLNTKKYNAINAEEYISQCFATGKFKKEIDDDKLPAPKTLRLKIGTRVIFTVNEPGNGWANGTRAIITRIEDGKVFARSGINEIEILPHVWKTSRYIVRDDKIVEEKDDEYRQLPLIYGWAITIHRAQGMTLDSVFVDLSEGAFDSGQAYVAISRVKSIKGLNLREQLDSDCFFHKEIIDKFICYCKKNSVIPS